jgi:V/A-type H+-transporting ATPase subunit C
MDKNTKFAAVNTKIASLSGKLLKSEDYIKMIQLHSPSEIAVYLKSNTSYAEFFGERDPAAMHRDEIERLLKEGLINYMEKLIHYFNGEYRNFFKCFFIRYEIYDLKRIARLIYIEKNFEDLRKNLVYAGRYRYIDMDMALKAKSIHELIAALEGTVYYPFIKNLNDENESENLYRFEMSLDRAYFVILEENVKKLPKEDQGVFYNLMGIIIDMLNLQWVYRGKKFYNLSPEEIFNYTINKGSKFNYRRIKEFCYARDIDEFKRYASQTPYAFMFKGDAEGDIFMERRMHRYAYFKLKSAKQRVKLDLSMVIAYLELIEYEIKDIISIIENVRYNMGYEEARKYLIKAV